MACASRVLLGGGGARVCVFRSLARPLYARESSPLCPHRALFRIRLALLGFLSWMFLDRPVVFLRPVTKVHPC
jgi:hypothetical protein